MVGCIPSSRLSRKILYVDAFLWKILYVHDFSWKILYVHAFSWKILHVHAFIRCQQKPFAHGLWELRVWDAFCCLETT